MTVRIKRLSDKAVIPKYAKPGDAGLDLTAVDKYREAGNMVYETGLAVEIPEGYVGFLFPRSSISSKEISLSNCVGVIDSGYRGPIIMKFKPMAHYVYEARIAGDPFDYEIGERIGQLIIMPYPSIELEEVEELSETERGTGGYGSTNVTI